MIRTLARTLLPACLAPLLSASPFYVVPPGTPDHEAGDFLAWDSAATNLQDAVTAAAATPGATVWVSNGHYRLTGQITIGNLKLRSWPDGRSNRDATIVNGNYPACTNRCFRLNHADALVEGFTITNGLLTGSSAAEAFGAGVYLTAGTLRNCLVIGNTNYAAYSGNQGGGVWVSDGLVEDCDILRNRSIKGPGTSSGSGGAAGIAIRSNGTVRRCRILHNRAEGYHGGGAILRDTGIVLESSLIVSNTAVYPQDGSGIAVTHGGQAAIRNCLIARNAGGRHGGGIYVGSSSTGSNGCRIAVENCTIAHNAANAGLGYGGGIALRSARDGNAVYVSNSIVHGNSAKYGPDLACEDSATYDFNLYADHVCTSNTFNIVFVGDGNITNRAPGFVEPSGPDYRLAKDSPCIDAGRTQPWMHTAADLAGNRRVNPLGGIVDIGCYEHHPAAFLLLIR